MFEKAIDTSAPIHELLASRWSGVAFDPSRPVPDSLLLSLAEAARWAPSCFGDQPWRYIICPRDHDADAWQKAFDCLTPGNQSWCAQVPVLVLTCCDTLFQRNDKPNVFADYDSGAASLSMCLQARALGLMSHQMAGFDRERARELFTIPQRYRPVAMMALGYQLPGEAIPEQFREKEFAPRKRNPLAERFFLGSWGKGLGADDGDASRPPDQ